MYIYTCLYVPMYIYNMYIYIFIFVFFAHMHIYIYVFILPVHLQADKQRLSRVGELSGSKLQAMLSQRFFIERNVFYEMLIYIYICMGSALHKK